jgi:diguanylate cyclase (GGDEF)-like protein
VHRRSLAGRETFGRRAPIVETDSLTGARTRAAGLSALDRQLDRSRQTGARVVVVRVGVVGLRTLNETRGHEAGDQLLTRIARITRDHLRAHDLISRHGGDEFLCAMPGVTLPDARERFSMIAAALADATDAGTIRTGFAELTSDETAAELIARAGRELVGDAPHPRNPTSPQGPLGPPCPIPDGHGEDRSAADPGPPSPDWPGRPRGEPLLETPSRR